MYLTSEQVLDQINEYRVENGYSEITKIDTELSEFAMLQAVALDSLGVFDKTLTADYALNEPLWYSVVTVRSGEINSESWFNFLAVDKAVIGIGYCSNFYLVVLKEDKKKEESTALNWLAGLIKPFIDWFGGNNVK